MTDEFLNTKQLAEWTGLAEITLARMRCKGEGPTFRKLGRRAVKYRRSDVETWLECCERQSTSEAT